MDIDKIFKPEYAERIKNPMSLISREIHEAEVDLIENIDKSIKEHVYDFLKKTGVFVTPEIKCSWSDSLGVIVNLSADLTNTDAYRPSEVLNERAKAIIEKLQQN